MLIAPLGLSLDFDGSSSWDSLISFLSVASPMLMGRMGGGGGGEPGTDRRTQSRPCCVSKRDGRTMAACRPGAGM